MRKNLQKITKQLILFVLLLSTVEITNAQCVSSFYDDFETGLFNPPWLIGTGYTVSVNNTAPAEGIYSMDMTGSGSFYAGPNVQFTSAQPTAIEWWAKTNNVSVANGYFVVGDANIATNNGIVFCYFNSTSGLRFFNTAGYNYPITVNTWYHIELKNINWTAKNFDIYINNVLWQTAFAFRTPASTDMTQLQVFNLSAATASYDKIVIGAAPPTVSVTNSSSTLCAGSSVTLTATGNATTYAWSSSVTNGVGFTPTATAIYTVVGTGSNSCQTSATTAVNVNQSPTVTAVSNTSILCTGQTATLTANGAITYTWNTASTNTTIAVTPSITSNYTVTGTDINGCLNAFVITQSVSACTGLDKLSKSDVSLNIYPNPAVDFVIIEAPELQYESNCELKITDVLGREVLALPLTDGKTEINIQNFNKGLYTIQLFNRNSLLSTNKLIVN
ncbi:MAG: T9SS type A sorting domain-containing protein [Bacteroidota bacterium]|nr:T9SS type A sorting domain-containing protein [Bacteroidota bacterium]MDP3145748.1 T9SS type A sorting domain-containing protein [Bacteroidota bacterium]